MSELISQSPRSLVFKDVNPENGETLVWKTAGSGGNTSSELAHEFEITSSLQITGIRTAHAKGIHKNKEAYAYEHLPGIDLKKYFSHHPPNVEEVITISLHILKILRQLHQAGICHHRIAPGNILYDVKTAKAFLIDFSVATKNGTCIQTFENWESELGFIAPELLPKKNQTADTRADLYALGVLMYWMLTGLNPFYDDDRARLVHQVLVKVPASVAAQNQKVPIALGDIISKLISKNPKDRYQTAHGLEYDLMLVLSKLSVEGWNGKMQLATQDYSDHLYLSETLYGRENELRILMSQFTAAEQTDESQICMVSGKAGVGKTSLIENFARQVNQKNGIFLSGKFQQADNHLSHQAMLMALKALATFILSQEDSQLQYWKQTISAACKGIGGTLIDLVPEFEHIIDEKHHKDLTTGSAQAESRLNFLFLQIIQHVASPTTPLVLFIDDLQWADASSLKSLKALITNRYISHFMFIGAYNIKEVKGVPLEPSLVEMMEERPDIKSIELIDLGKSDIRVWLKNSFAIKDEEHFSEIIYQKTLGTPFFIKALLSRLIDKGILKYKPESQNWHWDAYKLEHLQISDNVVEYIDEQLHSLSETAKNILTKAAITGKSFSVKMLSYLVDMEQSDLMDQLTALQVANFILKTGPGQFSFVHGRVHQTAYQLTDESERNALHYKIAHRLKADNRKETSLSRAFEISRHFTMGKDYETPVDREYLIELFTRLGKESKKNASFQAAFDYFSAAIERIGDEYWDTAYSDTLELYHQAAEVGIITGNREIAEKWLETTLQRATDLEGRVKAHEIKLNHLCETHLFAEAIEYLLMALDELGYGIKRHPSKLTILKEYLGVQWQLRNKSIDQIPNLPRMEDFRAKAFLKLTVMATISIYGWATDILPIVFFRQVRLSLKYGNSEYSAYSYAAFGFAVIAFMGNLNRGFRFGRIGLEVARRLNAHIIKTKVNVIFYAFLSYWKDSLITSLPHLEDAYIAGRQTGDLFYASFALHFQSALKLQAGRPLGKLAHTAMEDGLTLKKMGQEMVHFTFEIQRAYISSLYGHTTDPLLLKSEEYEKDTLAKIEKIDDQATEFEFYYYKMGLAFIHNEYELALSYGHKATSIEDETTPWQITYPNFLLLYTLSLISTLKQTPSSKTEKLLKKKLKLLQRISKEAPQNYTNKYELARAMYYAYQKKHPQAHTSFIKSIEAARWSGFIHEEALAREHFAYFLRDTNQAEFVESMIVKSFDCYKQWQAYAKCDALKKQYHDLITTPVRRVEGMASFQNTYDLNTIIKANQALSSETSLNGLLNTMTEMMINNASVDYVVVALKEKSMELSPMAYSGRQVDAKNQNLYPATLANVVARTKSTLVSSNLSQDFKYNFDDYIKAQKPVSTCCIPLINKGELLGIVYLENNLTENAFDRARIEFFQTITAQLAISLDSVLLYSKLENKVKERTTELVQKNDELASQKKLSDDLLLNILPGETAEELKLFGKTTAKSYESVTVMFIDIKNFSAIAEHMTPEELVTELDFCFKNFDDICVKHHLEKIKTIGDAYMAAAGIPENNRATPIDMIKAAMDMRDFTQAIAHERSKHGGSFFKIRLGIHTGPVVAGVVGSKKFQYDIWGNTVNLAARMEQNSEPGKINISQATYNFIKDKYNCAHRGKISAKNIGEVDMYFIEGPKG